MIMQLGGKRLCASDAVQVPHLAGIIVKPCDARLAGGRESSML